MPLKLQAPRKSPNWSIRGTYLGIYVDKSAGTSKQSVARAALKRLEGQIERGEYPPPAEIPQAIAEPTFLSAAVSYMEAGRPRRYIGKLIEHFGETVLRSIDQRAIDNAAHTIYPDTTPVTRNAYVYTPVSAILHHAGLDVTIRRPKGFAGRTVTAFLNPDDAFAIIKAADGIDQEFGLLLRVLLYTGCRLGEALKLRWDEIDLEQGLATIRTSKNGDPRTMMLRADVIEALAAHTPRPGEPRVFRFARQGGRLYQLLTWSTVAACDLPKPKRPKTGESHAQPEHRLRWVNFHTFRHTWATWMRRYGGADVQGLVATGNWRNHKSAARYAHVDAREEWSRVEKLPSADKKTA